MPNSPPSVLVAPLDWGLGHATRCIPIINELIQQRARVVVAANSAQKTLLKSEFPQIEFIETQGYNIRYKRGVLLKWGLLFRLPFILRQIKKENRWLEAILHHHKIDAIISDNRYGLFHKSCPCIFITHQLQIQSGIRATSGIGRWADRRLLKWNYAFIEKFSACWIPDVEGEWSVGGLLSHPSKLPSIPVKYIGTLSRFHISEKKHQKNSLLILISGPEPHRTEFENILFSQLSNEILNTVVVRGLPGSDLSVPFIGDGIQIWNHLPSNELNELLNDSEYIIARSGYSTIMDLLAVKKNAILIPTPGQTEQEYLGQYLHKKKWMYSVAQKNFNLQEAIKTFEKAELILPDIPDTNLHEVIEEFLKELSQQKENTINQTKSFAR